MLSLSTNSRSAQPLTLRMSPYLQGCQLLLTLLKSTMASSGKFNLLHDHELAINSWSTNAYVYTGVKYPRAVNQLANQTSHISGFSGDVTASISLIGCKFAAPPNYVSRIPFSPESSHQVRIPSSLAIVGAILASLLLLPPFNQFHKNKIYTKIV